MAIFHDFIAQISAVQRGAHGRHGALCEREAKKDSLRRLDRRKKTKIHIDKEIKYNLF